MNYLLLIITSLCGSIAVRFDQVNCATHSTPNIQRLFSMPLNLRLRWLLISWAAPDIHHMGLDCRTDHKVNQRCWRSRSYIAKVKIEPSGFGRCIYINHPNGLTTVMLISMHSILRWKNMWRMNNTGLKSWRVFLDIPANLFPVTKRPVHCIAVKYGSSQGPPSSFWDERY